MKIIKIPLNVGAMKKKEGIEIGPDKIEEKIKNYYLKEAGILPIYEFSKVIVNNSDIDESNKNIEKKASELDEPAIFLGGDHSITYSTFKGFLKNNPEAGILIFDAHLDCVNNFSPPTHEDYLRTLIEEKYIKTENVVLIGIRNIDPVELEFSKKNKLKIFSMDEISKDGINDVMDSVMSVVRKFKKLYVSVDIDVLDPAFAPGTGYCEPGGLSTRELIYCIQKLKLLKNIGMWDLVEVNPKKDINDLTVSAAAKLLIEMC